ncbi:MAG: magnesium transporter [Candidatus Aenigmarchaeota archaeon]|nr:magnesium transporter [Candidatus Aenigmarchaeota archaeon]
MKSYPPHTAGAKAIFDIPTARKGETIGAVTRRLQEHIRSFSFIDYVYVLDANGALLGILSIRDLFSHAGTTRVDAVMQRNVVTVSPDTHQENVADLAVKHGIKAVPVVYRKKLIGVVPITTILHVLNRALREDILQMAGIHRAHLKYENTLAVPLSKGVLHRLPWLLVGLVGIMLAALFIRGYEAILQEHLILAFFIPAIVYISDALGTQHQTLFVRDLAIMGKGLHIRQYFAKLLAVGAVIGIIVGGVVFITISAVFGEPRAAFSIAAAMAITLLCTSFTALATTIAFDRLKADPALGSGPLATIISDVTSVVVYFVVATLLLGVS